MELVSALGAQRLRQFDGMDFWNKRTKIRLEDTDTIINWGATPLPDMQVRVLNSGERFNKLQELQILTNEGVPTMTCRSGHYGSPPNVIAWIPRRAYHSGGQDFIDPPKKPDFYAEKLPLVKEYRVHSFAGRSIRAGIKVPRDGFEVVVNEANWKPGKVHPWVRSFDLGWRINYDGFKSDPKMRKLASVACKALKLTFGAVDIGERDNGQFYVLEVNRAPGIEGGTLEAYVRAINRWVSGSAAEGED